MAVSADGRYVVTVNAGYGTYESNYDQSLAVLDTQTGALVDFPDARTGAKSAKQTLYSGLAFSRDGSRLYATMGSTSDPLGDGKDKTGNAVVVYSFAAGKIAPERLIPLPLQQLAPGRKTRLIGEAEGDKGITFPAAIAWLEPPDRRSYWSPTIFRTTFCYWTPPADQSRSASIFRKAMPCPQPIRLRWRLQRTARAPLSRCGMRRRLWN